MEYKTTNGLRMLKSKPYNWILFFLLIIPFINIIVLFSLLFQYYSEEIEQFFRKTNWKKILFFIKDEDK